MKAALRRLELDDAVKKRVMAGDRPGAVWQIFPVQDSTAVREFIRKVRKKSGKTYADDPIHCQLEYLDFEMRERLRDEYGVTGIDIVQFEGDGIFIPAGAPHQVIVHYALLPNPLHYD